MFCEVWYKISRCGKFRGKNTPKHPFFFYKYNKICSQFVPIKFVFFIYEEIQITVWLWSRNERTI